MKNNNKSLTINCGSGKGTSIKQIIDFYLNKKLKIKIKIKKKINSDPAEVISKIGLLKKILNYKPKYSSIQNILNSSMNWENYINK